MELVDHSDNMIILSEKCSDLEIEDFKSVGMPHYSNKI